MPTGYTIIDNRDMGQSHIRFIRIQPTNIQITLHEVFSSIAELSWLENFDQDYIRNSFRERAQHTIEYIANNIITNKTDSITEDSGEYVVSELARKSVVETYNYLDIPIAELIKKQKVGNPGFDFYTENKNQIILFGEAKYKSGYGAYQSALAQIERFEQARTDIEDLVDIDKFCCVEALENANNGRKGFIAAFSSKETRTDVLIKHIKKNVNFQTLCNHEELICVAVNI